VPAWLTSRHRHTAFDQLIRKAQPAELETVANGVDAIRRVEQTDTVAATSARQVSTCHKAIQS